MRRTCGARTVLLSGMMRYHGRGVNGHAFDGRVLALTEWVGPGVRWRDGGCVARPSAVRNERSTCCVVNVVWLFLSEICFTEAAIERIPAKIARGKIVIV